MTITNSSFKDAFIGDYRLLRLLQQTALAEIYLGEHRQTAKPVAIKLLDERRIGHDLAKFFVHTSQLSRLQHPHIVHILDFGMDGNKGYLVMDYAPNGTLRQRYPKSSVLPVETVVRYVQQIASALQHIHQHNLVHCDIKPDNLLLGANEEVLISDFGIAVVSSSFDPLAAEHYEFEGTVIYAAPEQLQGKPRRSSDQYALGVVAYEWLCGKRPFIGNFNELTHQHLFVTPPPLRQQKPDLSPAIEQVIMKTLAKKVEARFPTIEAFAEALTWASQQSQSEHPASTIVPGSRRQFLSPLPFTNKFSDNEL